LGRVSRGSSGAGRERFGGRVLTTMNTLTVAIATAGLAIGAAAPAAAVTMSTTKSVSTGPSYTDTGAFPTTIAIEKFDSTLGTLNSATLTLSINLLADIAVQNKDTIDHTLKNVSSSTTFTVSLATPVLSLASVATSSIVGTAPTYIVLPAGKTTEFLGVEATSSKSLALDAGQRIAFTGTGTQTIDLDVSPPPSTSITGSYDGGLKIALSGGAQAILGLSVEYVYTVPTNDVPEPATLAVFGMSLAGLLAARRKRQQT